MKINDQSSSNSKPGNTATSQNHQLKRVTWGKDVIDKSAQISGFSLNNDEVLKKMLRDGVDKFFILKKLNVGEYDSLREILESYAFITKDIINLSKVYGRDSEKTKIAVNKFVARILSIDQCAPFTGGAMNINIKTLQFLENYFPYNYSKYLMQDDRFKLTNLEKSITLFVLMIKSNFKENKYNSLEVQEAFKIFLKANRGVAEAQIKDNQCIYISGDLDSEVVAQIKADFATSMSAFDKKNEILADQLIVKNSTTQPITTTVSELLLVQNVNSTYLGKQN